MKFDGEQTVGRARACLSSSKSVKINKSKVACVADGIKRSYPVWWLEDSIPKLNYLGLDGLLKFIFSYDSLSFCYWEEPKWRISTENGSLDGAKALGASLRRILFSDREWLDFENVQKLSVEAFGDKLGGSRHISLIEQRLDILRAGARFIHQKYENSVFNLCEESDFDVIKMINLLVEELSYFQDQGVIDGLKIDYLKKAQLLASDIDHCLRIFKNSKQMNGVEHLIGCADYKLPQVLHSLGILEYSPELSSKIRSKHVFHSDGIEENELRCAVLVCIDLIFQQVNQKKPFWTKMEINDHLWLMGQLPNTFDLFPHRVLTTFY